MPDAPAVGGNVSALGRRSPRRDHSHSLQPLEFKDAVIRETHHRVKNTLQMAVSLLSLQSRASGSAEVQSALRVAYDRLHVLAAVHESLAIDATDSRTVEMRPLLCTVASALEKSFSEMSARVGLHVSADDVNLGADQAIPLALFANEAITNAYRHGFRDGGSGEIVVRLRRTGEAVILTVSDTGVGTPQSGHHDGLGMTLMRGFARQLAATLSCASVDRAGDHAGGTTLSLWMPHRASPSVHPRAGADLRLMTS